MLAAIYAPERLARPPFSGLKRAMMVRNSISSSPLENASAASHEELLLRVAALRDRNAFVALFNYFAPRVKSYLLKHGADETSAEEVVQNTFVTIWEKAASFNAQKSAASTWIFTIARNKRIDMLRRQKFIEYDSDSPDIENAAEVPPDEKYATDSDVENLQAALADLPEEQARLLHMAFFEDKSHQAISDETHLPLGTVKSRLRLGMEKLRHILSKKERLK